MDYLLRDNECDDLTNNEFSELAVHLSPYWSQILDSLDRSNLLKTLL